MVLIPPLRGLRLNITVGRTVFVGYECTFTGHAPIDIADEVMIANRANLITSGHPVEPGQRRAYLTRLIGNELTRLRWSVAQAILHRGARI